MTDTVKVLIADKMDPRAAAIFRQRGIDVDEKPGLTPDELNAIIASYQDFLIFTESVTRLEGGVVLNFGSAVMGPEVYLKALAMARNVAHQEGRAIKHFTTGVFDLIPLDADTRRQAPKTDPRYYYRPWKTILVRTVADGGESFYVQGDHRVTVPHLYNAIRKAESQG